MIAAVKVGDLIQVDPAMDNQCRGLFGQVMEKLSWGVRASFPERGIHSLAWAHIEPTGGRAVWSPDGQRYMPPGTTVKHHP